MIPTKVRDLIPRAAGHIGIAEDDLDKMLSFYYKENKRHLSNLSHLHIILRGLGTMNMKGWELEKRIQGNQKTIGISRNVDNIQELQQQIDLYRQANEIWLSEQAQKQRVRELKNQYYANKNINDESQREDPTCMEE